MQVRAEPLPVAVPWGVTSHSSRHQSSSSWQIRDSALAFPCVSAGGLCHIPCCSRPCRTRLSQPVKPFTLWFLAVWSSLAYLREGLQTKWGQSLTQGREGQPMSCHADDAVLKAPGMTLNQSDSYFICLSREKCLARDSKDVLMAEHDLCFLLECSG